MNIHCIFIFLTPLPLPLFSYFLLPFFLPSSSTPCFLTLSTLLHPPPFLPLTPLPLTSLPTSSPPSAIPTPLDPFFRLTFARKRVWIRFPRALFSLARWPLTSPRFSLSSLIRGPRNRSSEFSAKYCKGVDQLFVYKLYAMRPSFPTESWFPTAGGRRGAARKEEWCWRETSLTRIEDAGSLSQKGSSSRFGIFMTNLLYSDALC